VTARLIIIVIGLLIVVLASAGHDTGRRPGHFLASPC